MTVVWCWDTVRLRGHLVSWGSRSEKEGVHCTCRRYKQPGCQGSHDWRQIWVQGLARHVFTSDPVSCQLRVDEARVDCDSRVCSVPSIPGKCNHTGLGKSHA